MRVIGIDPGIERTGFAIMETSGNTFNLLDSGCILTEKSLPFPSRLRDISNDIKSLIKKFKPTAAALEEIFFSKNTKTAIRVSHARGVILEVCEELGVSVVEFNPAHVKIAVTGNGRADKSQVKKMVQCLLGVYCKYDDTSDAIACAICLLNSNKALERN